MVHPRHKKIAQMYRASNVRTFGSYARNPIMQAAHIPLRMRSASNPGNVGHDWVKRRFVERLGASAGDRLFVPARLNDNPLINRDEYTSLSSISTR